jgi:hypothetical protein
MVGRKGCIRSPTTTMDEGCWTMSNLMTIVHIHILDSPHRRWQAERAEAGVVGQICSGFVSFLAKINPLHLSFQPACKSRRSHRRQQANR